MKKIYMILALGMISVMSWATVSITVNPKVIDFGTIVLDENGEAEANTTATLTWSGLIDYCSVFMDTIGAPDASADYEFWAVNEDDADFWYGAQGEWAGEPDDPTVYVGVYAIAAGEYSIKYHFYSYANEDDWYNETNKVYGDQLQVKVKVVEQTTGIENTKAATKAKKIVRNGQVLIIRNGEKYSVMGTKVE